MATFLELVECEEARLVLARADLPPRRRRTTTFGRIRARVTRAYRSIVEVLRAVASEIRERPLLAPLFLLLGVLLLLAGALLAMALVLALVTVLLVLSILGWVLVFSKTPRFRRSPEPSSESPRDDLPRRVECSGGVLGIEERRGLRAEALVIRVTGDELGLASLRVLATGAPPFLLVVDGVRGLESGVELAQRVARALGFSRYTAEDGDDACLLAFTRDGDDEERHPYRDQAGARAGAVPRFERPMVGATGAPPAHPRASFSAARDLTAAPRFSKLGDELRIQHASGEGAGRWSASLRAFGAAVGVAALVRAVWLFAEIRSGDFGWTSWIISLVTWVLLATKWVIGANAEISSSAVAIIDGAKRTVTAPNVGRLEDVCAVLARETDEGEERRVAVWVITRRGDSKLWEMDSSGREVEAWKAGSELAACVATMLGVDWAWVRR